MCNDEVEPDLVLQFQRKQTFPTTSWAAEWNVDNNQFVRVPSAATWLSVVKCCVVTEQERRRRQVCVRGIWCGQATCGMLSGLGQILRVLLEVQSHWSPENHLAPTHQQATPSVFFMWFSWRQIKPQVVVRASLLVLLAPSNRVTHAQAQTPHHWCH